MALTKSQSFKLGIFVLSALALLVAVVGVLGGSRWFRRPLPMYTLFNESVQGLEAGAPVKFRGVPIGQVRRIAIGEQEESNVIRVDMALTLGDNRLARSEFITRLQSEIQRGARARLEYAGITGLKYVEIDYYAEKGDPEPPRQSDEDLLEQGLLVPGVASLFSGLTSNLNYTLSRIASIDFEGIGQDIGKLVASVNRLTSDEQIPTTIGHLRQASSNLESLTGKLDRQLPEDAVPKLLAHLDQVLQQSEAVLTKSEAAFSESVRGIEGQVRAADLPAVTKALRETLAEMRQVADDLRHLSTTAIEQLVAAKAGETTAQLRQTLEQADTGIKNFDLVQHDLRGNLRRLGETLATLNDFLQSLQQDPASLVHGKRPPVATKTTGSQP